MVQDLREDQTDWVLMVSDGKYTDWATTYPYWNSLIISFSGNYLTCRFKNLWLQIISNSLPSLVRSTFGRKNSAGGTVFSLNSNEKMKRIMASGYGIVFHYKHSVLWIVSYIDLPLVPNSHCHWLLAQCQHSIV